MRVLIDTNILLDYFAQRGAFFEPAHRLLLACMEKKIKGYIAAHSVLNTFYILRHSHTPEQRRNVLRDMCRFLQVVSVDKGKVLAALNDYSCSDFEDCVQAQCASACRANVIITRNVKDFAAASIPAISPDEFCRRFLAAEEGAGGHSQ